MCMLTLLWLLCCVSYLSDVNCVRRRTTAGKQHISGNFGTQYFPELAHFLLWPFVYVVICNVHADIVMVAVLRVVFDICQLC